MSTRLTVALILGAAALVALLALVASFVALTAITDRDAARLVLAAVLAVPAVAGYLAIKRCWARVLR